MSAMEKIIVLTMTESELFQLLKSAVKEVVREEFAPLRREFEDRLITLREASKKLGVTDRTMNNLEKRGELLPTRIGAKVMYRESDITQFVNRVKR